MLIIISRSNCGDKVGGGCNSSLGKVSEGSSSSVTALTVCSTNITLSQTHRSAEVYSSLEIFCEAT